MKKLSILFSLFAGLGLQAQDTLYTVSGQKISGKVIEINQTEIKYKKANNPEGPTYVVDKTDVALIEYKNGTKEIYGTGEQEVAMNEPEKKDRLNIVIGGWGWPLYNPWNFWGGYRVIPRIRHHHHHYYKPFRHHHHKHFHYGRRGR